MAVPVSELEGLRDELLRARARGLRVLMYEGKRTEYASDSEMAAAIAALDREIANATAPSRGGTVTFTTSKGI